MKKDAYYFSHDANAQDDPKLMLLIDQMAMEGIGIYWCLIEKLRAEKDYSLPISVLPSFAHRWHTSAEKVQTVVKNYNLFKISSQKFFSVRLKNSMQEKTERARASALTRYKGATALQPHSNRTAIVMQNDAIKVKESKVKKSKEDFNFFEKDSGENTGLKPGMVL